MNLIYSPTALQVGLTHENPSDSTMLVVSTKLYTPQIFGYQPASDRDTKDKAETILSIITKNVDATQSHRHTRVVVSTDHMLYRSLATGRPPTDRQKATTNYFAHTYTCENAHRNKHSNTHAHAGTSTFMLHS